jgi:hypothetical protein
MLTVLVERLTGPAFNNATEITSTNTTYDKIDYSLRTFPYLGPKKVVVIRKRKLAKRFGRKREKCSVGLAHQGRSGLGWHFLPTPLASDPTLLRCWILEVTASCFEAAVISWIALHSLIITTDEDSSHVVDEIISASAYETNTTTYLYLILYHVNRIERVPVSSVVRCEGKRVSCTFLMEGRRGYRV